MNALHVAKCEVDVNEGDPVFAKVAVPVPLGRAFSYRVPDELVASLERGARVLCEFGRRKVLGVVLEVSTDAPPIDAKKIKPLIGAVGSEPVIPGELLDFLAELGRYYLAPIGEVMRLALPAVEREALDRLGQPEQLAGLSANAVGRLVQVASLVAEDTVASEAEVDEKAQPLLKGQAALVHEHLRQHGPTPASELTSRWKNARTALRKLEKLGLVQLERRQQASDPFFRNAVEPDVAPELTSEQQRAVDAIVHRIERGDRRGFLLDGVTASGKTEVYLRAVARVLELGGGAVVLVPEIALTPQLVARFRARLGDRIAVLHSALSNAERYRMWRALRSGELRVAVGARSALFAPVQNLKLICVDEEHDGSFKQEEGVRYHARDMALLRAHRAGAVCVLGSATPSLSSEHAVRHEKLQRLRLPARAKKDSVLPDVEIVDLRTTGAGPSGDRLLSLRLHRELENVLERKEQAILFLNRRGFAPSVLCEGCGFVLECPQCSVALTLHRARSERLECHYCEYWMKLPKTCARCGGARWAEEGTGTERVESLLAEVFPEARLARLDRDVASGAKSERVLDRVRRGEVDILVGTQMVTKGHDLPRVTLVGVLNADAALTLPDFRAAERCFHQLVQVAGRAGRGGKRGKVLVQTRQPEHAAIRLAAHHDVAGFVELEMQAREELGYPPYSRMALIRLDAVDEMRVRHAADQLARLARQNAGAGVEILGPAPAPLARLRNRYRYRFMLRAKQRKLLQPPLVAVLRARADSRVRVAVDVDPVSML